MTEHPRHKLSQAELEELLKPAKTVANLPYVQRVLVISRILAENASLVAECNAHREARGMEPLPTYEPNFKR